LTGTVWWVIGFLALLLIGVGLGARRLARHPRHPRRTRPRDRGVEAASTAPPQAREEVARILDTLRSGTRLVVVSGLPGAGQRELLVALAGASVQDLRVGDVVDVTISRPADGVDLLEDVARSLRRRGLVDFSHFDHFVAKYRARASDRPSTAERVGAVVQQGAALGGSLIPVVGPTVTQVASSQLSTELRDWAVDRVQGTGELNRVYAAFVSDLSAGADSQDGDEADTRGPLVLVLDGIDERLDDPGVRVLIDRVLPAASDRTALVVAARDPDVPLGPKYLNREQVWLRRLADDRVRAQLAAVSELPTEILEELVQSVGGSPERLANVLQFQRSTTLDPKDPNQRTVFTAQALAWAESGRVYRALAMLDDKCRPLGFALSTLRVVNRPLLDEIAAELNVGAEVGYDAGELLRPERRPPWLTVDVNGWRIPDDRLRQALLDEFRRSHPDLHERTHRRAAEYHRRALWSSGPQASDPGGDERLVPQRSYYGERHTPAATFHEAEWLYHRVALDADDAFPLAVERVAEALQADDRAAVLTLLAFWDLELPGYQRYAFTLLSGAAAAALEGALDRMINLLEQVLPLVPTSGPAHALLVGELAGVLFNAEQRMAARRRLLEAYELAAPAIESDVRCLRTACLAKATHGLLLMEDGAVRSGGDLLDEALTMARDAGDPRLVAEIHRVRVRGHMSSSYAAGEQAAQEALRDVDASLAPGLTAAISAQLALMLTVRESPDYPQAERLLHTGIDIYRALGEVDSEVEALAQLAALVRLRGGTDEAEELRVRALQLGRSRAGTHELLGHYAGWADDRERELQELRAAVAVTALQRTTDEPDADAPTAGAIHALLALYATRDGVDDVRRQHVRAARDADAMRDADAAVLVAACEGAETAEETTRAARRSVESALLRAGKGESFTLFQLGSRLLLAAQEREGAGAGAHGAWDSPALMRQQAVSAFRGAVDASPDEASQVLALAEALAAAGDGDGAERCRRDLITALRERLASDPANSELLGALIDALVATGQLDEAVEEFRRAEDLAARDRRLLTLTAGLSGQGRWTEASALVEEELGRSEREPELLNEAVRLLDPVTNEEEQGRAARLADAFPDRGDFALVAARWLATTAREQREARRELDVSVEAGSTGSAPAPDSRELRPETLQHATELFRRAAGSIDSPTEALLEAAELLLDVADVAPPHTPAVWPFLADGAAGLEPGRSSPLSDRAALCLARLVRGRDPSAAEATALLARLGWEALEERRAGENLELAGTDLPPPLVVEAGAALVSLLDPDATPSAQRLYDEDGMIATARAWLGEQWGFALPGVRVRRSANDTGSELTWLVRGAPRTRVTLGAVAATTLGPEDVEAVTGTRGSDGCLPDGRAVTWIDEEQAQELDTAGHEVLDTRSLLCLALLDTIGQRADELLDTQRLCEWLSSRDIDARWELEGLPVLASVLRSLLRDGFSIDDVHRIVEGFDPTAPPGFETFYAEARRRLGPTLVPRLLSRRPGTRVTHVEVGDLEALWESVPQVRREASTSLPLSWAAVLDVRRWASQHALHGAAVVVPTDDDRQRVADVFRAADVAAAVVTAAEAGVVE
jgi:tetratricopeptide (TPR) repeat protein